MENSIFTPSRLSFDLCSLVKILYYSEMFELFNVNDQKGLTVSEIENGVVDMTQTGDDFDRLVNLVGTETKKETVLDHN